MPNMVVIISKRAKKIRRKGEDWQEALGRAKKQVMGKRSSASLSPSKKTARKKTAKAKKDPNRQTEKGKSNLFYDRMVKAKAPGKRKVKTSGGKSHAYYERRQIRSDAPGKMTGTAYNFMILSRMQSNYRAIGVAEELLGNMIKKRSALKKGPEKTSLIRQIAGQKKYISSLKNDNRMLKRLI